MSDQLGLTLSFLTFWFWCTGPSAAGGNFSLACHCVLCVCYHSYLGIVYIAGSVGSCSQYKTNAEIGLVSQQIWFRFPLLMIFRWMVLSHGSAVVQVASLSAHDMMDESALAATVESWTCMAPL